MKFLLNIFFIASISQAQDFSPDKFTVTPNTFFENKLVTEVNVYDQRPEATNFATTVFRLSPQFRIQLYTTELRYFEKTIYKSDEAQGNFIMNVIYKGEKEMGVRYIKIVLADGSDFDIDVDSSPSDQLIEQTGEHYSTFSFVIPFEILYEILASKSVEFRFRGFHIYESIMLEEKPRKFFNVFYGMVQGYYGKLF